MAVGTFTKPDRSSTQSARERENNINRNLEGMK